MNSLTIFLALGLLISMFGASHADGLDVLKDFQGIRYIEEGRPVGLPMGGIGAGSIEITSQGTLAEFANLNNWVARIPSIPGTGLWITYTTDGKTRAFPLGGGKVCFEGNFPFAKLSFPDLPVDVTLWCWSPFILHDVRHSAYPAMIFDAQIHNRTSKPADVGLVLSYGTDYSQWLRQIATSHLDMESTTGFHEWELLRDAASSHAVDISVESSGSEYTGKAASGITFSTKALIGPAIRERVHEKRADLEKAYLRAYDFTPVDISGACNRSYLHNPFNESIASSLCFSDLKSGRRTVYDIPFDIVDDTKNAGKSCVMAGPDAGDKSVSIPVNQKADCLFFFGNCAGWAAYGTAQYTVHYTDGTDTMVPLHDGRELSDWIGGTPSLSPASVTGPNGRAENYVINVFAVPTDGSKTIGSVELRKSGTIAPIVFAITAGRLSALPLVEGVLATRNMDLDRMVGNMDALKLASNTDADYTIAALRRNGGRTLTYQIAGSESIAGVLEGRLPVSSPKPSEYAVEQRLSLGAGESGTASVVCGWYAPNHRNLEGHVYGHKYQDWFKASSGVVEEIARDHDKLLGKTKEHFDMIATSTLPKWYREMLQSNFYLLPACTWLTRDGISFTYESPDRCPAIGTLDVRYYGSFTKLAAFPELDNLEMRELGESQLGDGFVPHDMGVGRGLADIFVFPKKAPPTPPKTGAHDYDGYWVNLPIKFCLQVARNYQWTGDTRFLKEMWPRVKRAVAWVQARDGDDDGLPETYYGYDGWTMAGKSGYDANQWIAMLVAVAGLADELGEPGYAAELRATHAKALAQTEKHLWTGRYFRQGALDGGKMNDMVSCLQVAGDWYGDMMGFQTGVPRSQVRSSLQVIDDVLGKDSLYGVTVCLNPDGSSNGIWQCYVCGTGWSLFYASHCMYRGMDDIALRVADEIWTQYMVQKARVPWRQEEAIEEPHTGSVTDRLLRDMRLGVTMTLAYSAAGLGLDIPKGTAVVKPADWVWKDSAFVLPVIMPKWLGQVKYKRAPGREDYTITNTGNVIRLKSLKLRTKAEGMVSVSSAGKTWNVRTSSDGTVAVGPIVLGKSVSISLASVR